MSDEFTLRDTAKRIERNRELARETGDLRFLKGDRMPHWHHSYNGQVAVNHKFDTIGQAYAAVKNMANKSEPNVQYYEEGPVEIEARIRGTNKRMMFMVAVIECYLDCNRKIREEDQKRMGWL